MLAAVLLLPVLIAAPAQAQDPAAEPNEHRRAALAEVLAADQVPALAVATDSALETIAIRPDIAFASDRLQNATDVRPWKRRIGADAQATPKPQVRNDPAAVRRALVVGLQGATTCWQRARLTGMRASDLGIQATFAANGRVERLTIHGGDGARDEQLGRCLDYVARRIRLPEPPGERVFVYTRVAFATARP
ncbi:MAG: hypothetical protein D6761_00275 [Candidatus Dadabacteria bacterium]|nr:MAG: hypothetical protein D6761_00275 [Candidatus Dadabacteria bacterium]